MTFGFNSIPFLARATPPVASSGVTRQTPLIRDVAGGVASWEVDCGFSASAGDIVLVEAYANRTAGTSQNIQTLTVNGESATRHRAVNTGSAHFGMAAVFSVQLVAAITSTSKLLVTLEGDAEGNVFVLQPTRLVGYAATPHNSSTVNSVDTSQTITLNIPADGAAFAIFCANTGDAQTITGLTQDYGAGFTNQSGRYVAMGFNTGMSVETGRAISVTDAVPNSISRRGCAISFAKV